MEFLHPCFERDAHCRYGRIHLPVAPACNIQCVYCKRLYDCLNESRPGVCSRVETPDEAAARAAALLKKYPQYRVIGIAGPGEPLANEETFEVLELLNRKKEEERLDAAFCLSTNGLYLPETVMRLHQLGVEYLTVTMNALSEVCAQKIYLSVWDHGNHLSGLEAARLLLARQQEGIRRAVELGFHVKVNMVLMDGINDQEVQPMAEKLAQWGVYAMNMNSVINVTGNEALKEMAQEKLKQLRKEAAASIRQIDFCRQCRADAAGIPGRADCREN